MQMIYSLYNLSIQDCDGNRILNSNVFALTILNIYFTFTLHLQLYLNIVM